MIEESLRGAVPLSHSFLRMRVEPGSRVMDATCGNGHDTLFLARLVGPGGKVWAFDIQEKALANTRALLEKEGCLAQTELVAAGHEHLDEFVGEPLKAAIFNLGYLPGGDRCYVTRPEQTLAALNHAARLLLPGGVITACIYTGHPGGAEEGEAVEKWAAHLEPTTFNSWASRQLNRPSAAPYVVLVEKSGKDM
jgi:ubiquinone/menaquinone biosynthesis C-methylase UbiE